MLKKPLFLLLLLCFYAKAFSAVFVVTSNADSGPGTLRDALTQAAANGTATQDSITFNIADTSQTGRTITLLSEFPPVTSNLVMDASTQQGSKFWLSDAKIKITIDKSVYIAQEGDVSYMFEMHNVSNVEIYGLYVSDFFTVRNSYDSYAVGIVVDINNGQNIIIGAPGKGNMFSDNDYEIDSENINTDKNIVVMSNYLAVDQNGYNSGGQRQFIMSGDSLTIGGNTLAQGNHLSSGITFYGNNIKISHNFFGADLGANSLEHYAIPESNGVGVNNLEVSYNTSERFRLNLSQSLNFNIYANIDTLVNYPGPLGSIGVQNCTNGIIGSTVDSLKNVFFTYTGGSANIISSTISASYSADIQVLKNEIVCSNIAYEIYDAADTIKIPQIKVLVNNSTEYSGTATPLSIVYIYYDDSGCDVCSPLKFFTQVTADVNGQWKINGDFTGKRWVANTTYLKNSSEFTQPNFSYPNYYNITQPSCGQNNGSVNITGYSNVLKFIWFNSQNIQVDTGATIKNLGPGSYYVIAYNGNCSARSPDTFYLYNVQVQIIDTNVQVTQPSCGKMGSINGVTISSNSNDPLILSWRDQNNTLVGSTTTLTNVPPGQYTFSVTDTITKCTVTYGPVTLKNTTGPNIDQSHIKIQSTNCGQSTGSITSIPATGTGTLTYTWTNSSQQTVSTDSTLVNQPAGTYTLQVTDNTQCGPVYSSAITIPETNGITIDSSKLVITTSSCGNPNGSVTGLLVSGATTYQWSNANGNVISTTNNLTNAAAGKYTFSASNTYGCSKTLTYTIPQQPATTFPDYADRITTACYTTSNGSIVVAVDDLVKSARWVDSTGNTVGTSATLSLAYPGTYQLYLTDQNGCESFYKSYVVPSYPQFTVANYGTVSPNECGLNNGSVNATTMSGGTSNYTYQWTDANGKQLGTNSAINNLTDGSYFLNITDAGGCGSVVITYVIPAESESFPAPSVSNVQLCSSGSAIISVNNASADNTYRLYNSPVSSQVIDEQKGGRFTVNVAGNTSYYISEVDGTCESNRSEVDITVGLSSLNIANTFTPNGDGVNDYWQINGIQNYPNALVQVFNRYGQKLFESRGYGVPFDGTYNGQKIPAGVYYYIINLNTNCNLLSGSLTILR